MICDYNLKCVRDMRIMKIMVDAVARIKTLKDLHLSFVQDRDDNKELLHAKISSKTPQHLQKYNCDSLLEQDDPALKPYDIHKLRQSNPDQLHLDHGIHSTLSDLKHFDELLAPVEISLLEGIDSEESKAIISQEYSAMKKRSQLNEYMAYYDLLQNLRTLLQDSSLKSFSLGCPILCHTIELQTLLFILQEAQSKGLDLVNVDLKCKAVEERDLIKLKKKVEQLDHLQEMTINKIRVFSLKRPGTSIWSKAFESILSVENLKKATVVIEEKPGKNKAIINYI